MTAGAAAAIRIEPRAINTNLLARNIDTFPPPVTTAG